MAILTDFGWDHFHPQFSNTLKKDMPAGRVISIKGLRYHLVGENGEIEAELSGKLLYGALPEELPKVGDWVLFADYGSMGYIIDVLPRLNAIVRKTPGNRIEKQVLAANVDFALVVQGLDRDFNVRRLERYLVQIAACGVEPVIILNKADLVASREQYLRDVSALQWSCPVYFCSTLTGEGLDNLQAQVLQPCKTYVLVGSSGAGKSSLLNALMLSTTQTTGGVSDSTSKGKHTTTARELFRLRNGSLVIDNPGMREFGLTGVEGNETHDLFPLIHALSVNCRFTDCNHLHDAGCAVKAALDAGRLDPGIYESYLKLVKEQHRFSIGAEDKKRQEKQFGKISREAREHRRKYKF